MKLLLKVHLKMIILKDMELYIILTEIDMKENGKMVKEKGMA